MLVRESRTNSLTFETADLDVQLKQMRETLSAAGVMADMGEIALAGRDRGGLGGVRVNIGSSSYASFWPEWAYGVAEAALRFNKKVIVVYNNVPKSSDLLQVICTNVSVWRHHHWHYW